MFLSTEHISHLLIVATNNTTRAVNHIETSVVIPWSWLTVEDTGIFHNLIISNQTNRKNSKYECHVDFDHLSVDLYLSN